MATQTDRQYNGWLVSPRLWQRVAAVWGYYTLGNLLLLLVVVVSAFVVGFLGSGINLLVGGMP